MSAFRPCFFARSAERAWLDSPTAPGGPRAILPTSCRHPLRHCGRNARRPENPQGLRNGRARDTPEDHSPMDVASEGQTADVGGQTLSDRVSEADRLCRHFRVGSFHGTFVPSISKLHDNPKRALSQWRSALVEMQNGKCFYDENSRNEFARSRSRIAMVICSGGQDLKSCPRMPKVQQR